MFKKDDKVKVVKGIKAFEGLTGTVLDTNGNQVKVKLNLSNDSELQKNLINVFEAYQLELESLDLLKEDNVSFDNDVEPEKKICCICGEEYTGYGNNAEPYKEGYCCDECNKKFVIPSRLNQESVNEGYKDNIDKSTNVGEGLAIKHKDHYDKDRITKLNKKTKYNNIEVEYSSSNFKSQAEVKAYLDKIYNGTVESASTDISIKDTMKEFKKAKNIKIFYTQTAAFTVPIWGIIIDDKLKYEIGQFGDTMAILPVNNRNWEYIQLEEDIANLNVNANYTDDDILHEASANYDLLELGEFDDEINSKSMSEDKKLDYCLDRAIDYYLDLIKDKARYDDEYEEADKLIKNKNKIKKYLSPKFRKMLSSKNESLKLTEEELKAWCSDNDANYYTQDIKDDKVIIRGLNEDLAEYNFKTKELKVFDYSGTKTPETKEDEDDDNYIRDYVYDIDMIDEKTEIPSWEFASIIATAEDTTEDAVVTEAHDRGFKVFLITASEYEKLVIASEKITEEDIMNDFASYLEGNPKVTEVI